MCLLKECASANHGVDEFVDVMKRERDQLSSPRPPTQEITLWRKGDVVRKSMSHQAAIASQRFEGSAASESALEQAAKEESG